MAFPSITRGPLEELGEAEGLEVNDLFGVGEAEALPAELTAGEPERFTEDDGLDAVTEGLPVELGAAESEPEGFADEEALEESAAGEGSGLIVAPTLELTLEETDAEGESEQPDTFTARNTANATVVTTRSFMLRFLFLAVE